MWKLAFSRRERKNSTASDNHNQKNIPITDFFNTRACWQQQSDWELFRRFWGLLWSSAKPLPNEENL
jgi:hypothetical protein